MPSSSKLVKDVSIIRNFNSGFGPAGRLESNIESCHCVGCSFATQLYSTTKWYQGVGTYAGVIKPPPGPLSSSSTFPSVNRAAKMNPPTMEAAMSNISLTINLGLLDQWRDKIQRRRRNRPLLHVHSVFLLFR